MKIDLKTVAVLGLSILLLLMIFGYININMKTGLQVGGGANPTVNPSTVASGTPLPLYVTTNDPLAGNLSGATVTIRNTQGVQTDSFITDAYGKYTTANTYAPGTELWIDLSLANYVTRHFDVIVPSTASQISGSNVYPVQLQTIPMGTPSVYAQISGSSTQYTSGQTINFTTLGVSSITLTIHVTNTGADKTGYWSSYDSYQKLNQNLAFVTCTSGSSVNAQGMLSFTRGSNTYYYSVLQDGYPYPAGALNAAGFTRQSGTLGTVIGSGDQTLSLTISKGTLTAGSTQSFNSTIYAYFDTNVFAANGNQGSAATALTTFNFAVAA
jgi:hypothetical protein